MILLYFWLLTRTSWYFVIFKKIQSFSYFDNLKRRNQWLNIHLNIFDVKILWNTLISSLSVVWLMILFSNNIILKVLLNLGSLKWFFWGVNFHYMLTKKLQRKYFDTDSQCFQRILCHFLGKRNSWDWDIGFSFGAVCCQFLAVGTI